MAPPIGRQGEGGAPDLDSVYRSHAAQVARWAARLAGPGLDVEDLVHEVFLTVHRLLPGLREPSRIQPWLYRITENVVRDRRRRERRRWLRTLLFGAEPQPAAATPVDSVERQEATARVYQVLEGLRDRHRTVLILFELEGLSGEAIAELLGVPCSTVWVWLHRARADFRRRLKALPTAEEEAALPAAAELPLRWRSR